MKMIQQSWQLLLQALGKFFEKHGKEDFLSATDFVIIEAYQGSK